MIQSIPTPSFAKKILPQLPGQFIPGLGDDGVSYIWIPWYKQSNVETFVEFEIEACTATDITIAAEVIAPSGSDDSVFLQMDDEAKVVWHVGSRTRNEWTWKTLGTPFVVTEGKHRLRVLHREVCFSLNIECYLYVRTLISLFNGIHLYTSLANTTCTHTSLLLDPMTYADIDHDTGWNQNRQARNSVGRREYLWYSGLYCFRGVFVSTRGFTGGWSKLVVLQVAACVKQYMVITQTCYAPGECGCGVAMVDQDGDFTYVYVIGARVHIGFYYEMFPSPRLPALFFV